MAKPCVIRNKKKQFRHNIIMELAPGIELFHLIKKEQHLPLHRWINIILSMLHEVKKIHAQGILHCDIKPENFRVDLLTDTAKLIDFGMAIESETLSCQSKTPQGSRHYAAPEVFAKINNEKTEIYALGKTIAAALDLIYKNDKGELVLIDESHSTYKINKKILDPDLRLIILNFLKTMTASQPDQRPTLANTLCFFTAMQKNLQQCVHSSVGLFDLREYAEIKQSPRNNLLSALQCVDEVILIDTYKETDAHQHLAIKNLLDEKNINVVNKILHAPEMNPHEFITNIPDMIAEENPGIRHYFYFTTKLSPHNITDSLRQQNIHLVSCFSIKKIY